MYIGRFNLDEIFFFIIFTPEDIESVMDKFILIFLKEKIFFLTDFFKHRDPIIIS
jgi:hypothetical protein